MNDNFSEEEYNEEEYNEEEYNEEYDDELDDETKELVYNRSLKDINDIYNIKDNKEINKSIKKINNQTNKKISLSEFNKQTVKEEPTKFVSKRVNDKKKDLGTINNLPIRHFNPRLPPYNLVYKKKEKSTVLDLNDMNLFPTL